MDIAVTLIIQGIEDAAHQEGYAVLLGDAGHDVRPPFLLPAVPEKHESYAARDERQEQPRRIEVHLLLLLRLFLFLLHVRALGHTASLSANQRNERANRDSIAFFAFC